jgi:hypothetical protein
MSAGFEELLKSVVDRHGRRFLGKVRPDDNGCWMWIGAVHSRGYGHFWSGEKLVLAHRFSYTFFVGPIPPGLVIDHLCRTPLCVNPAHLEAVTERVNILRGTGVTAQQAVKTHCVHGHPLSGENLMVLARTGERVCRICLQVWRDRWSKKMRERRRANRELREST